MRTLLSFLLAFAFLARVQADTPAQILSSGKAFAALSQRDMQVAQVALLDLIAFGALTTPSSVLSSGAAFYALSANDLQIAQCQLLNQIYSAGGLVGTNSFGTNTIVIKPGNIIDNLVTNLPANTTIEILPGIYNVTNAIHVPQGGALLGHGPTSTTLKFYGVIGSGAITSSYCIVPSNNCVVANLTVTNVLADKFQANIGMDFRQAGHASFTNCLVKNCYFYSWTDLCYLKDFTPSGQTPLIIDSIFFDSCWLDTRWDGLTFGLDDSGQNDDPDFRLAFKDSILISHGINLITPGATMSAINNASSISEVQVDFYNGGIIVTNSAAGALQVGGATLRLWNPLIIVTNYGGGSGFNLPSGTIGSFLAGQSGYLTSPSLNGKFASGANAAAGDLLVGGGQSTGTGRGGAVRLQTTPSGSSGSTANTFVDRAYISAKEVTLTESSPTLVFNVSVASGKTASLRVFATTRADDSTDFQVVSEEFTVAVANKAGTTTGVVSSSSPSATKQTSGTLTTAWTAVGNGNGIDIKNNAVSSLTQTTLVTRWRVDLDTPDTGATITPQ